MYNGLSLNRQHLEAHYLGAIALEALLQDIRLPIVEIEDHLPKEPVRPREPIPISTISQPGLQGKLTTVSSIWSDRNYSRSHELAPTRPCYSQSLPAC